MSYEQPDWHESAEASYSYPVSSNFSFSIGRGNRDPRTLNSPSMTLNDLGSYVHSGTFYSEGKSRLDIATAYGEGDSDGEGGSLRLEGKTEAFFDGSSFKTAGVKVQEAEGCSCTEDKCIRARGKLNARYSVHTKVTLPSVSDYPDLSTSQKKRLQTTINTILAPHEQKHVAAFRKYNGTTSRPFDLTICKGEFDSAIQSMFDQEESARRQAAQDESDALDPFFFEFEL